VGPKGPRLGIVPRQRGQARTWCLPPCHDARYAKSSSIQAVRSCRHSKLCSILVRMSSLAVDRLLVTQAAGHAAHPAHSRQLTASEEATTVAELKQAYPGWAALLAECAGLALGYDEHEFDAAQYRQIAELCMAAGVDQMLIEAWIEVGRQQASTAAAIAHKTCVLWAS
jgi:hypothetical protein